MEQIQNIARLSIGIDEDLYLEARKVKGGLIHCLKEAKRKKCKAFCKQENLVVN
jgi:hypothetical protein